MPVYSVQASCCLSTLSGRSKREGLGNWRGGCFLFAACRTSVHRDLCSGAHEVITVVTCVGRLARVWRRLAE